MRISELARRGGVTVATVKYYLREGLVSPGILTSSTQARYDDSHVARLRLVRALLGPGGLSIAQARAVLGAIDDPHDDMFAALGTVQQATLERTDGTDTSVAKELVESAGWRIHPESPELALLAEALEALDDADFTLSPQLLRTYLDAAEGIARAELDGLPSERSDALRYVVLGTILVEPVLLALRRLAEQHVAAERLGIG